MIDWDKAVKFAMGVVVVPALVAYICSVDVGLVVVWGCLGMMPLFVLPEMSKNLRGEPEITSYNITVALVRLLGLTLGYQCLIALLLEGTW